MNAPRVDIMIPTWQRPEKLARCLASIEKQTYPNIEVHAVEDTDRLFAFGVWNRFLRSWTGDLFVYLCDDVELAPVCIDVAVTEISVRWPDLDGLCGFHQQIAGKEGFSNSAMGMFGRAFAYRFPNNEAFCPDYSRFHADSELGKFARAVGRFAYRPEAGLIHHHPAHEKSEMDYTHSVVREPGAVARDRETYEIRRDKGLLWGQSFERVRS
jgi:cellulose synthase/poly-beta-1,6-N-acetylglucosamine synthase-like glycosyltransferase